MQFGKARAHLICLSAILAYTKCTLISSGYPHKQATLPCPAITMTSFLYLGASPADMPYHSAWADSCMHRVHGRKAIACYGL